MKQAILLLTNRTDNAVISRYFKLVKDYGNKADIFLLFDNSSSYNISGMEVFERIYGFSVKGLMHEGYTALESGFLGNCHYPLLKFHKDNPSYDYCWLVEDDVEFSGDWSVLFDAFVHDSYDLVSTKIRTYADDPHWYWWDSVHAPDEVSYDELYASFNPIYRLSAHALEILDAEMRRGWRGHYEALVATIIKRNGMTMCDMGGDGMFLSKEKHYCFYTESTHTWIPLMVQRWKPNMIYHPIKEKVLPNTTRRNCVLSVVGENSLHKKWLEGNVDRVFDVHLIVYDLSFRKHYDDADFLYGKSGRVVDLIKDYFMNHDSYLSLYDYFFIIDEMSPMTAVEINSIFEDMAKESSEFALVGMSMPCFHQSLMAQFLNNSTTDFSVVYF